jgi:FkbM family methyltransferase
MKNKIKYILQRLLGYSFYLYTFSIFKILTLKKDRKEGDFFHFLALLSEEEGVILDLGANIGIMTYHLANRFPKNQIFAVEPIPSNYSVLLQIIQKFKLNNVKTYQLALGTSIKEVEMVLPYEGKTKMQGLSHIVDDEIKEWNEGEKLIVQMDTVDNLFNHSKVKGIKLDVENYEFQVLKGAENILKRDQPVIYCELWENENRYRCFSFLEKIGYQAYVVENNSLIKLDQATKSHQNFIFKSSFNK